MKSEILSFVRTYLEKNHIQSIFLDEEQNQVFDLGLREYLLKEPKYHEIISQLLEKYSQKDVYFLTDVYCCCYVLIRFPDKSHLLIGPYSHTRFDDSLFYKLAHNLHFPADHHLPALKDYYMSLPLVNQEDSFHLLILSMMDFLWDSDQAYTVDFIKIAFDEQILYGDYEEHTSASENIQKIEQRYTLMKQLLRAIQSANARDAIRFLNQFLASAPSKRFSNGLKDTKNWLIIFNTQLRCAAENANVHPYYLDQISSKFSFRVDALTNPDHKSRIMHDMVRQYCLYVSNYSSSDYSKLIQKCIMLIEYDLTADLSLSSLADQLNISSSYLSAQFKKETGSTLTEYVTHKRISQSLFYLNSSDMQIQTIGQQVGIYDMAYFSKVFKKYIGMSPTEYRQSLKNP